jgi:three-Cys-motif partner protein
LYEGREQTYVKHFFLGHYLERVAYNIGSFANDFVYVDGFSGPWMSKSEKLQDTSFAIAIGQLKRVKAGIEKRGRKFNVRCIFCEADDAAFTALVAATANMNEVEPLCLHGEFEFLIPEILGKIGGAFSLVLLDPTGWTGFALSNIKPILEHAPGEVIINFMYDHINRFLTDERAGVAESHNRLFGGPGWERAIKLGDERESSILDLYMSRVRAAGNFEFVTSTRIFKPKSDRTYFHLIYCTRHVKGLIEFRNVEDKAFARQVSVRLDAKQSARIDDSGQLELIRDSEVGLQSTQTFAYVDSMHRKGVLALEHIIRQGGEVTYEYLLGRLLQIPLVTKKFVDQKLSALRKSGEIEIPELKRKERIPKLGYTIRCTRS